MRGRTGLTRKSCETVATRREGRERYKTPPLPISGKKSPCTTVIYYVAFCPCERERSWKPLGAPALRGPRVDAASFAISEVLTPLGCSSAIRLCGLPLGWLAGWLARFAGLPCLGWLTGLARLVCWLARAGLAWGGWPVAAGLGLLAWAGWLAGLALDWLAVPVGRAARLVGQGVGMEGQPSDSLPRELSLLCRAPRVWQKAHPP